MAFVLLTVGQDNQGFVTFIELSLLVTQLKCRIITPGMIQYHPLLIIHIDWGLGMVVRVIAVESLSLFFNIHQWAMSIIVSNYQCFFNNEKRKERRRDTEMYNR